MKISYYSDTDTLLIVLSEPDSVESTDLDENTILDLDAEGNLVAITMEHASTRTDVQHIKLSGIAA